MKILSIRPIYNNNLLPIKFILKLLKAQKDNALEKQRERRSTQKAQFLQKNVPPVRYF